MDEIFSIDKFPYTSYTDINLDYLLDVYNEFQRKIEDGELVGPQGPQGPQGLPGPSGTGGLSDELKAAILQLAEKVVYTDANGPVYYNDLYQALYASPPLTLVSITATFNQTGTIYDTDSLTALIPYLTVAANYSDGTSSVVSSTDYTLSGALTAPTSTIQVSYAGQSDTFSVNVTVNPVYLVSITAAFNQTGTVYDTDSLTVLDQYLTVTGTYSDSTTATISSIDYVLSGSLVTPSSTITVSYGGQSDTFTVSVTANVMTSITAVFIQGLNVIYDTDSLSALIPYLTVTGTYTNGSTTTISSSDYTLSGSLTAGTSTITVTYGALTDTFTVNVTAYNNTPLYAWDFTQSLIDSVEGEVFTPRTDYAPTQDATGLHFTAAKQEIHLTTDIDFRGKTIEIDVASAVWAGNTAYHSRFVMLNYSVGDTGGRGLLIWRSSGGWAAYGPIDSSTSKWTPFYGASATGTASDMYTLISGHTVKLVCGSGTDKTCSLYLDNVLVGTVTIDLGYTSSSAAMKYLHIGGINNGEATGGNQFFNVTLTGLRIYNNV